MANLKRKILSLSNKYKAVTEVESGTKPSKPSKDTISTWLLPGNMEKIENAFQYGIQLIAYNQTICNSEIASKL